MAVYGIAQKKKEAKELRRKKLSKATPADAEDDEEQEVHEAVQGDLESNDEEASVVLDESDGSSADAESSDGDNNSAVDEDEEEEGETSAGTGISSRQAAGMPSRTASKEVADDATQVEFNEPLQWVERMALTATRSLPVDLNADDDPKREEAFIQQALLSVARGTSLLEAAGVPWKRPDDYFAEMYKSDTHMSDVRQAMDASKSRIEAQAHRRAMKDQKKYGKEVQAEVQRQRAKYKRDMQDRISDWKKKKKGNSALQDYLENDEDGGRQAKRGRTERNPQQRNTRPGGKKKRPGKNTRSRR